MAEGDESLKPISQFTSIIPHFWYDIIGQIVPGSYLIVGLYWLGFRSAAVGTFTQEYLTTNLTKDSGEIRFLPLLVVFALSAYFIGGVLGPFSFWSVQRPLRRFDPKIPVATLTTLKPVFGEMTEGDVEAARRRCTWVAWRRAPELAIIFSRWDAMAFAARSTALSSLLLVGYALYAHWFGPEKLPVPVAGILVLLAILVGSMISFKHFRECAIISRFEILAVVLNTKKG